MNKLRRQRSRLRKVGVNESLMDFTAIFKDSSSYLNNLSWNIKNVRAEAWSNLDTKPWPNIRRDLGHIERSSGPRSSESSLLEGW